MSSKILEQKKKYTFNPTTKKYVFHTEKRFGKNYVFSKDIIDTIIRLYSNYDKQTFTVGQISIKCDIPIKVIKFILSALEITHASVPFSDETIETTEESDLVADMLTQKKFNILQKFEKKDWEATIEDAQKWREFKILKGDVIENVLNNWTPPKRTPTKLKNKTTGLSLICSINDVHLGEHSKSQHLFAGKDYSSNVAEKLMDDYCDSIISETKSKNQNIKDAYIIVNGDFLHSCFNGTTAQGTKLHSDLTNEEMFEKGLNVLVRFVEKFQENFGKVLIKFIKGNHDSVVLSFLGYALQNYFRADKNIGVEIVKTWATVFKVNKVAVLAFHGGSDSLKHANIPKSEGAMKAYIQELFLSKHEELGDCKHRIVITGHLHSFNQKDMGSFDFYCMGASVLGDSYADKMNFPRTKPRQNYLILDDSSVKETVHYYF